MSHSLNATTVVEHKHPGLPRFICIPLAKVAPWKLTQTTTVEGTLNGVPIGRRSLKHWEDRRCWWMDLPEPLCRKAGIDKGDRVKLTLQIAANKFPEELTRLLQADPVAKRRWESLTTSQQRMLREEILAAKQPATRARRAAVGLGRG